MKGFYKILFFSGFFSFLNCETVETNSQSSVSNSILAAQPSEASLSTNSTFFFQESENALASGQMIIASEKLHEGIVAYRIETGRFRGEEAAKVNKIISHLTRMRRRLNSKEQINGQEFHALILQASLNGK